jgi:hypothetical protein
LEVLLKSHISKTGTRCCTAKKMVNLLNIIPMKTMFLFFLILSAFVCKGQSTRVVEFRHDLRWAEETRFPHYFSDPEVQNEIFGNIRNSFSETLGYHDLQLPHAVSYKVYQMFGKQKVEMPRSAGSDTQIGIFSFITRATVGEAMLWNLRIIVRQGNRVIHDREVTHEIEYFNNAGYFNPERWLTAAEFVLLFDRLVNESLGKLPVSDEKIIVGSFQGKEEIIFSVAPGLQKNLFKIKGAWQSGNNFSAMIESEKEPILTCDFRKGAIQERSTPGFSGLIAGLLTEVTGLNFEYDQKIKHQVNGSLHFPDQKYKFKTKWIEFQTRSVKTGETESKVSDPVITEVYDDHTQVGYMLYYYEEIILTTAETKRNLYGLSKTLGRMIIHSVRGVLHDYDFSAEYHVADGVIFVSSGNDIVAAMVLANCNPESNSFSNQRMSENRTIRTSSGSTVVSRPSLKDESRNEWYYLYLRPDVSDPEEIAVMQALVCLFMSMGS